MASSVASRDGATASARWSARTSPRRRRSRSPTGIRRRIQCGSSTLTSSATSCSSRGENLLEIVGSGIVGNVRPLTMTCASAHGLEHKGERGLFTAAGPTLRHEIIDTNVQGSVTIGTGRHNSAFVDGLTVHGSLQLRSYPHTIVALLHQLRDRCARAFSLWWRGSPRADVCAGSASGRSRSRSRGPHRGRLECVGWPYLRCSRFEGQLHGYVWRRLRVANRVVPAASAVRPFRRLRSADTEPFATLSGD